MESQTSCDTLFSCQVKLFASKRPLFVNGTTTVQTNVMVQWLVLLFRVRNISDSKPGPKPAILIERFVYSSLTERIQMLGKCIENF